MNELKRSFGYSLYKGMWSELRVRPDLSTEDAAFKAQAEIDMSPYGSIPIGELGAIFAAEVEIIEIERDLATQRGL